MRIVVLGAGTVGHSIANLLCLNRHAVTVIDTNADHVRRINETLDVRAMTGSASQSSVLFQAGVSTCDLCLAVTGDDEVNLISASMAKAMGARRTIARVYAPIFRDLSTFDYQRHFRIDRLLSLEHLTALELARSIRHPGSVILENVARGEIEVHEVIITAKARGVGKKLQELGLPRGVRIGSISRDGTTWIAGAQDQLEPEDRITIVGKRNELDDVKDAFRGSASTKSGVVIAGGGETGYHLARILEGQRFGVVLVEGNRDRCDHLASNLRYATVVNADATRRSTLEEERVGSADFFVACMGEDENNILASVEAKDIGTGLAMSLVGRPDYAHVVGKLGIDIAVSPREVIAKEILGFLNSGPVISRASLADGSISVVEVEITEKSQATDHVLANLPLPDQCLIVAIVREGYAQVPGGDDRLRVGDTAVVLVNESQFEPVLQVLG